MICTKQSKCQASVKRLIPNRQIRSNPSLLSRRVTNTPSSHLTAHHLRMIDACLPMYSNEATHTHPSFGPRCKIRSEPVLSLPLRRHRSPGRQRVQARFVSVCPDLTCQLPCVDVNADGCFQNRSSASIKSCNVSLPLRSPSFKLLKSVDSCGGWSAVLPNRIKRVLIWRKAFRTLAAPRAWVCAQSIACRLQLLWFGWKRKRLADHLLVVLRGETVERMWATWGLTKREKHWLILLVKVKFDISISFQILTILAFLYIIYINPVLSKFAKAM